MISGRLNGVVGRSTAPSDRGSRSIMKNEQSRRVGLAASVTCVLAASALGQSCPTLGVPFLGVPNWDERVLHVLTNAARISPGAYATTMLGTSTIMQTYPSVAPLAWDVNAGAFSHGFVSGVMSTCPTIAPSHTSCSGAPWLTRFAAAGLCSPMGEQVAANTIHDPVGALHEWLKESPTGPYPADHTSDVHRAALLNATPATIGTGYASGVGGSFQHFWVVNTQGSCTTIPSCGPLHSGTHLVNPTTLDFLANYYDAGNQPARGARLVIDGVALAMTPFLGTAARGTYKVTLPRVNACRGYYFEFDTNAGTTVRYPGSGLLQTFGDGCSSAFEAGKLVINEVDYDQPGTDTAEFIELKNTSPIAIDLAPYRIELWNGANTTVYLSIPLSGVVQPGQYYVIAGTGSTVPNVNLRVAQISDWLQNGSPDGIVLRFVPTDQAMDSFCYEGSMAGITEGLPLPASPADNNVTANWGYSRVPDGDDTNITFDDWELRTISPGGSNTGVIVAQQPVSVNTCADVPATFTVLPGGTPPFRFQWQWSPEPAAGWIDLVEGTNSYRGNPMLNAANVDTGTLEASQIMPAASSVQIRCLLTNPSSSVESNAVRLSTCACFTCPADFNFDGGVDGEDVSAFFARWEAGHCDADTNQDGGVDGADVDVFFAAWEAGGC